jgi:pyruvate/2-oxoglutarate dehydrogenase complex dihydrolipoamide dehydrogenase (E3) component
MRHYKFGSLVISVFVETTLGRCSYLEGLGLDNACLDYNEKEIHVDGYLSMNQSHISAVWYCACGQQFPAMQVSEYIQTVREFGGTSGRKHHVLAELIRLKPEKISNAMSSSN